MSSEHKIRTGCIRTVAAGLAVLVLAACADPPPAKLELGTPPKYLAISEGGAHFGGEVALRVPEASLPGRFVGVIGERRYLYPVGGSIEHAMKAALKPVFDRVLIRQPSAITVKVNLLSFRLTQNGAKRPADCEITVKIEVTDERGRLNKGVFSASASGPFNGRDTPDAVWKASYAIADKFKDWLAASPAVANSVARHKQQMPAVSAAGPRAVPLVPSKRYRSGYASKVAAVIGINDYTLWPSLEGATSDARRIAATMSELGFDVIEIYDKEATRERILRLLGEELQEKVGPDSLAVIFFAGHGYTETLPQGVKRGYIIPVDGDTDRVFSTGISMEKLRDLSNRLVAKHVYYAMDSCYSGLGLTRGIAISKRTPHYLDIVTQRRAVQMITAGQEGEQAGESGGRGIFSTYLLRALEGEADFNGDGFVTASEIGAYVPTAVSSATRARQNPKHGTLEGSGEIVFDIRPINRLPAVGLRGGDPNE